jgi:hypothetical protein
MPESDAHASKAIWPTDAETTSALVSGIPGEVVDQLSISPERWIHRRVEAIKFDQRETSRCESVDFTLPSSIVGLLTEYGIQEVPVPVATLAKEPLANLDVRNGDGVGAPVLTRLDNEAFAIHLLQTVALKTLVVLGESQPVLEDAIERILNNVVKCDREDALRLIETLDDTAKEEDGQAGLLWDDENEATYLFRNLLVAFAEGRLLLVQLPVTPKRQIVKYSYTTGTPAKTGPDDFEQRPSWRSQLRGRLTALCWWHQRRRYVIWHATACASYHFEVTAPPGFEVKNVIPVIPPGQGKGALGLYARMAAWLVRRPWQFWRTIKWYHTNKDVPAIKSEADDSLLAIPEFAFLSIIANTRVAPYPTRWNVHLAGDTEPLPARVEMEVHLRLPRRGYFTFAWLSTLLTFLTVVLVAYNAEYLTQTGGVGAGVTAILAVVGFLNLYLSRPNEHPAFNSMLSTLRLLLWSSVGAAFGAAWLLLTNASSTSQGWSAVIAVSFVSCAAISFGFFMGGGDPDGLVDYRESER